MTIEETFLEYVHNSNSMEEAMWLTSLWNSLTEAQFQDAQFQAWVIAEEYGHTELLYKIDEKWGEPLNWVCQ